MDQFLLNVLRIVERDGGRYGITLVLQGTMVTGQLISFNEFMTISGDEAFEKLSERNIETAIRGANGAKTIARYEGYQDPTNPEYLHLADVELHTSRDPVYTPLLRVKVQAVNAWNMGRPSAR